MNAADDDAMQAKFLEATNHMSKVVEEQRAQLDAAKEALLNATGALVGAVSAYKTYASRSRSVGRSVSDPFFTTRLNDMNIAAEKAHAALKAMETKP